MRKIVLVIALSFCFSWGYSQDSNNVPFSKMFYKYGTNSLNSVKHNYGANYVIAGIGTYGMVKSGFDWRWSNAAVNNKALIYSGIPFGALGFILPVAMPLGMYLHGKSHQNVKTQITGLALGQAALQGFVISSAIKTFTGRKHPAIMSSMFGEERPSEDFSNDFAFGLMERGVFDGWPSSHTTVIFSMAVTLTELYPDNVPLKIACYSYAGLTALAMSFTVHWASDAFAGALIGYAIGKSVGRGFNNLLNEYSNKNGSSAKVHQKDKLRRNLSFSVTLNGFLMNYRF